MRSRQTPRPQQMEAATHRAWPALHHRQEGPWTLRFAAGYTKRSNSAWIVNPLTAEQVPTALEALPHVEAAYRENELVPVFRIPDFLPPQLDAALAERGYQRQDTTLVLLRALGNASDISCKADRRSARPSPSPACRFDLLPVDQWFTSWKRCAVEAEGNNVHSRLLRLAAPGTLFGRVGRRHDAACCGLGVPDDRFGLFGIFDVATRPDLRRQGHASRLMRELLRGATRLQAQYAYLQVVQTNTPARSLYSSLAFAEAYRYWYRVAPTAGIS